VRLHPRPHWENLQRSPDPLAGFKGLASKSRKAGKKSGREEKENGRGRMDGWRLPSPSEMLKMSTAAAP